MSSTCTPLASSVALTTTATASTNTAETGTYGYHTLYLEWTPGTAANVLTVTVEYRVNGSTAGSWTQLMSWDDLAANGTLTRTLDQLQHTATGTTLVPLAYVFQVHAHQIRIKYSESEAGGATKGTITARLTSSHS